MPIRRFAALVLLPLCAAAAHAAPPQRSSASRGINTLNAPVPTPILEGKRAFISFELGDVTAFPSSYSGGPERAYSEFFAGMKAWGRYDLVLDPRQADVIFAIRFVDPPAIGEPQIRLGILDPATHATLWGFVEDVDRAVRKKHRDDAFSDAVQELVSDVQILITPTGGTPTAPPQAGPTPPRP